MPIKRLLMLMILVTVVLSLGLQVVLSNNMIDRYYRDTAASAYRERVENLRMLASDAIGGQRVSRDLLARFLISPIVGIEILAPDGRTLLSVEDRMQMMHGRMMQRTPVEVEAFTVDGGTLRIYRQGGVADSESVLLFRSMLRRSALMAVLVSLVLALTVAHLVSRRLTKDLTRTAHYAERIATEDEGEAPTASGTLEIAELQRALDRLSRRLRAQVRTQKEKADVIVHEVRTPLTILRSTVEGMRDGVLDSTSDRYDRVLGEVERLIEMVEDLPSIVELKEDEEVFRKEIDLSALIFRLSDGMRPSFERREIALEVEAPADLTVVTDDNRVIRILHNLLANALKYSDPGGSVHLRVERVAQGIALHVTDEGVGIDEEALSRLFEPYYRGENAGTRPGEGLGLYTAKKDAESIGARLTVDSVLGKGSHFTLTLPTA